MNMTQSYDEITDQFPFLTVISYIDKEYIGVVQNSDDKIMTMYVYSDVPDQTTRKLFLECGDIWWWESNRQIPINIFMNCMGYDFSLFKSYLKTFIMKEVDIIAGPSISLSNLNQRRVKRRNIALVRKV